MPVTEIKPFTAARNACKLCSPLGACLAFKGVEGCVPLLHGSQGCATYIRRYMISHYKEPVDIASSSFGESAAIFGGRDNLFAAIRNVIRQYDPKMIGIATTCLSETIGDDVRMYLDEFRKMNTNASLPVITHVSTPSYSGTHAEGFYATLRSLTETLAQAGEIRNFVNVISSMISPADIRYLKEMLEDFNLDYVFLPDYSDTLDGPAWETYQIMPAGGTKIADIQRMGQAMTTLELGGATHPQQTAGVFLLNRFRIPRHRINIPIGIRNTDEMVQILELLSGHSLPPKHQGERNRLIDAYADAHKYIFEKRAVLFGEEDFVIALADFLLEIGIVPVLCASGGDSGKMKKYLEHHAHSSLNEMVILDDVDFLDIEEAARSLNPDILIGNSKGYKLARSLQIPFVRVGFPIHDRIGGTRLLHTGYRGTQQLFDRIVNALIESRQDDSDIGYFYM